MQQKIMKELYKKMQTHLIEMIEFNKNLREISMEIKNRNILNNKTINLIYSIDEYIKLNLDNLCVEHKSLLNKLQRKLTLLDNYRNNSNFINKCKVVFIKYQIKKIIRRLPKNFSINNDLLIVINE